MRNLLMAGIILSLTGCDRAPDPAPPSSPAGSSESAPGEDLTPESLPAPPSPGEATAITRAANSAVAARLPLDARGDFRDAERGLLARIEGDAIRDAAGQVVWPIADWDFLDGPAPATVNPSLWRQSQLNARHGLFEVTDGLYQVRGYDLAVMSVIRGETGWIIVDPLLSSETAAAALELVNDTLGNRPVTGILYTHSHADHFGGVGGVISEGEIAARDVPVIAPAGFSTSAVAENLLAGNHMSRRAALMFGNRLERGPRGHVGSGLGPGLAQGTVGLILPTEEIAKTGTVRKIDGVTFEFMDASGTEAPAEFMFYLPQFKALCTAEVATATLHNVLTPRGAKVRDALRWSRVIDAALMTYGDRAELVFASHHWPTWGRENVGEFLANQRDIYRYVHDRTLNRANAGAGMVEAAEAIAEPDVQGRDFSTRGYYGTLNHNAKAVYQHYFGWWNGVPARYHALPHARSAPRYVEAMGGLDAVIETGANAFQAGEYRWAAEVLNHAVFAAPDNAPARNWLAAAYEQLGFQAESGAWRSYYLAGAKELRDGVAEASNAQVGGPDVLRAVPSVALMDLMAVRYAPDKLQRTPFTLNLSFPDTGERVAIRLDGDMMLPRMGHVGEDAAVSARIDRRDFERLILREAGLPELMASGALELEGDPSAFGAWLLSLETPPANFNIVTP